MCLCSLRMMNIVHQQHRRQQQRKKGKDRERKHRVSIHIFNVYIYWLGYNFIDLPLTFFVFRRLLHTPDLPASKTIKFRWNEMNWNETKRKRKLKKKQNERRGIWRLCVSFVYCGFMYNQNKIHNIFPKQTFSMSHTPTFPFSHFPLLFFFFCSEKLTMEATKALIPWRNGEKGIIFL